MPTTRCATDVTLVCRVVARATGRRRASRCRAATRRSPSSPPASGASASSCRSSVDGATVDGLFRLKLQDLDPDAGLFRLYVTDICRRTWLEQPAGVLGHRRLRRPAHARRRLGLAGRRLHRPRHLRRADRHGDQPGSATSAPPARRAARGDLFCVHLHAIDSFYHLCSAKLDERRTPDPAERAALRGRGARHLPPTGRRRRPHAGGGRTRRRSSSWSPTTAPSRRARACRCARILAGAGLLADGGGRRCGPGRHRLVAHAGGAAGQLLRAREPRRARAAAASSRPADLEDVRDALMRAMLDYRDAGQRRVPVQPRRPGGGGRRTSGCIGDGVGDVVYAVHEEFADEHGQIAAPGHARRGRPGACARSVPVLRRRRQAGTDDRRDRSRSPTSRRRCATRSASTPPLQADGRSLLRARRSGGAAERAGPAKARRSRAWRVAAEAAALEVARQATLLQVAHDHHEALGEAGPDRRLLLEQAEERRALDPRRRDGRGGRHGGRSRRAVQKRQLSEVSRPRAAACVWPAGVVTRALPSRRM